MNRLTVERNKKLHIALWVAQVLVAAMFLMAGFMKLGTPVVELARSLPWTSEVPESFVRTLGVIDLLGGLGLILPSLLRIKPVLTPVAAVGIVIEMLAAIVFHVSRGETSVVGLNVVLMLLAGFVAWGRFSKEPIASR